MTYPATLFVALLFAVVLVVFSVAVRRNPSTPRGSSPMTMHEMRLQAEQARFSTDESVCDALVNSERFETVAHEIAEAYEDEYESYARSELFLLKTRYADRPNAAVFVVYRDRDNEMFSACRFPTEPEARKYFDAFTARMKP